MHDLMTCIWTVFEPFPLIMANILRHSVQIGRSCYYRNSGIGTEGMEGSDPPMLITVQLLQCYKIVVPICTIQQQVPIHFCTWYCSFDDCSIRMYSK